MEQVTNNRSAVNSHNSEPTDISPKDEGVRRHLWTKKEYYKMAELNFFQGKRVELIEGEVIEMSPMNKLHATAIRIVLDVLKKKFITGYIVDSQLPMSFGKISEPEPDIAVIEGDVRDFLESHPKTAALIIEVSDSTLQYDRTKKAALYARNKIQDYWILNLKNRCLEVYRRPKKDNKIGFIYAEKIIYADKDEISPLAKPEIKIKIADLLP